MGTTLGYASSDGAFQLSLVSAPLKVVPIKPVLTEYFRLTLSKLILFFFKKTISLSLVIPVSRIGTIILASGQRIFKAKPKRIWSLPAPVDPCAKYAAFSVSAVLAK